MARAPWLTSSPRPRQQPRWTGSSPIPHFRLAEDFIKRALIVARQGVAILARTVFIESVGRYREIFEQTPPTKFAQFTERVPMVKGRLDAKASTATGYAWIVWEKNVKTASGLMWVPPY